MNFEQLKEKARQSPDRPGVYYHKDVSGQIIYIGKASSLKKRLASYFSQKPSGGKLAVLVAAIDDFDYSQTADEVEALFYEAELIRRYRPTYNILGLDGRIGNYIRLGLKDDYPSLRLLREPLDDQAEYFGPYFSQANLRQALNHLRPIFPFSSHRVLPKRACLDYHLGLCPGPETANFDRRTARSNLLAVRDYLKGRRNHLIKEIQKEMSRQAKKQDFKQAAILRDKIKALAALSQRSIFSDRQGLDLKADQSLLHLAQLTNSGLPTRIEAIDISHQSGRNSTASLVVFKNGVADRSSYRRFKMRLVGNNDTGHIFEVVSRRFSRDNQKRWRPPNLLLIDGGKGQVAAAAEALGDNLQSLALIGLAKRLEMIVGLKANQPSPVVVGQLGGQLTTSQHFWQLELPAKNPALLLLRQIRDESHRFAKSYHNRLAQKEQTASPLLDLAGIGPKRQKKLLDQFGSWKALQKASSEDLKVVVGQDLAAKIKKQLKS